MPQGSAPNCIEHLRPCQRSRSSRRFCELRRMPLKCSGGYSDITTAHVDASCTSPADEHGQMTVKFKIDLELGPISEHTRVRTRMAVRRKAGRMARAPKRQASDTL